jgi:Ca2+-binding RTX toxin-like protein
MAADITLNSPFNMQTFNFADMTFGSFFIESTTEVEITGSSGTLYTLEGTGFGIRFSGSSASFAGTINDFTIGSAVTVTGLSTQLSGLTSWSNILGSATVNGSSGDDVLLVGDGGFGFGNGGDDTIGGVAGSQTLDGGAGDDTLNGFFNGTSTATYADATSGVRVDLRITGAQDVGGGDGIDTLSHIANLTGSSFNDRLIGDDNANTLDGNGGRDTMNGEGGDDLILAYNGADNINGGAGNDTLHYIGSTGLTIAAGSLRSVEHVIGTDGDDNITASAHGSTLDGAGGNDTLNGSSRADVFIGSAGDDVVTGNGGNDTLDYSSSTDGVTVDLSVTGPQAVSASQGSDTITGVDHVIGSQFADTLTGTAGHDVLLGGAGNDDLNGGAGNDVIDGGDGHDTLIGGAGHDTFQFTFAGAEEDPATPGSNPDDLVDYTTGQDHLHLTLGGVTFIPNSIGSITGGTWQSGDGTDLNSALGTIAGHSGVLFTPDSGDHAGHTYLVLNLEAVSESKFQFFTFIEFGTDSHIASFGTGDFI